MFKVILQHVILIITLRSSCTERRIIDGKLATADHKYLVYLIKPQKVSPDYDYWLCGGALVSESHIITAAACVEDVQHVYAIAGYNKYVTAQELDKDKCTKHMKKKVVLICVPKLYSFDYAKIEKWAFIDIAVLKVESPYKLGGPPEEGCSYGPDKIPINYDPHAQKAGAPAIAFGWGHTEKWRKPNDKNNYNQQALRYASTLIYKKEECLKKYSDYKQLNEAIKKYMICTSGEGNFDENGDILDDSKTKMKLVKNGCVTSQMRMLGMVGIPCDEDEGIFGRNANRGASGHIDKTRRNSEFNETRRQGICQNDHGSPLVAWLRGKLILIGVASVFMIDKNNRCEGPFLFTSTECNGAFIDCIINSKDTRRYGDICDQPAALRGYDLSERIISWRDHPDGPAANELD